ncbi:MAG: hypothetical protein JNK05_36325 [Myxococcales bacterium]|nr:hypothetical protein [Myxococcales bacterium]
MSTRRRSIACALCVVAAACGGPAPSPDSSREDSAPPSDGGPREDSAIAPDVLDMDSGRDDANVSLDAMMDASTPDSAMMSDVVAPMCSPYPAFGTTRALEVATMAGAVNIADVALTPTGAPMVLYQRSDGRLTVAALWNGQWTDMPLLASRAAAMAIDLQGNPQVILLSSDGAVLRYARWNGFAWRYTILDRGAFDGLHIAVDAMNRVHLAWWDLTTGGGVQYARAESGRVGAIDRVRPSGSANSLSLAVAHDGTPHLAWYEGGVTTTGAPVVHSARGAAGWVSDTAVPAAMGSTAALGSVQMAIDSAGRPVLYVPRTGDSILARFDGARWNNSVISPAASVSRALVALRLDSCDRAHLVAAKSADVVPGVPRIIRYLRETSVGSGAFEQTTLLEGGTGTAAAHGNALSFELGRDGLPRTASVSLAGVVTHTTYDTADAPAATITPIVAATGGTVRSPDGSATLTIPARALAADTTISVGVPLFASLPMDIQASRPLSPVYSLSPNGTTFATPATLTAIVPAEALWSSATADGIAFAETQLRSASGVIETAALRSKFEDGVWTDEMSVAHFSEVWSHIGGRSRGVYVLFENSLEGVEDLPVGRTFTVDVTARNRSSTPYALDLIGTDENAPELSMADSMVSGAYSSREQRRVSLAVGASVHLRASVRCDAVTPTAVSVGTYAYTADATGPLGEGRSSSTRVRCIAAPNCDASDPVLGDASALSVAAFGDNRACNAARVSNVVDTVTEHPESTPTISISRDYGARDDAHFDALGATFVDLDAAGAARLDSALSCGTSGPTTTLCSAGATPLQPGRYFVGVAVMKAPVVPNQDSDYLMTFMLERDGAAGNNWQGTTARPFNFETGSDTWISWSHTRTAPPALRVRTVTGATTSAVLSSVARIALRGNAFLIVTLASEIASATPTFGAYAFRGRDFGSGVNRDGSYDTEPPLATPRVLLPVR